MISLTDIAWIAGLLEGEGSFSHRRCLLIQLQMTDKDVVERAAALMGIKKIYERVPKEENRKRSYSFFAAGYRAAAWMLTIYSFMGERRKEKIQESIARWKENRSHPRAMRGEKLRKTYATCHPNRPQYSKTYCYECYKHAKLEKNKHAQKKRRQQNGYAINARRRFNRLQRQRCGKTSDLFQ